MFVGCEIGEESLSFSEWFKFLSYIIAVIQAGKIDVLYLVNFGDMLGM